MSQLSVRFTSAVRTVASSAVAVVFALTISAAGGHAQPAPANPEAIEALRTKAQAHYQQLTPQQRQKLQEHIKAFQTLSPEQKQARIRQLMEQHPEAMKAFAANRQLIEQAMREQQQMRQGQREDMHAKRKDMREQIQGMREDAAQQRQTMRQDHIQQRQDARQQLRANIGAAKSAN